MALIKPFPCVRPIPELASAIAALPYDVYNRAEAKLAVQGDQDTFLRIDRPETQFPDEQDMYADEVYQKAAEMLAGDIAAGKYVRDEARKYYVYELTMDGRSQTGIVAAAAVDDYLSGTIKRHENTLAAKEQDRIRHIDTLNAQTGPIFLAYRSDPVINEVVQRAKTQAPLYDFAAEDGIGHRVFEIAEPEEIRRIETAFAGIDSIYIADGHHRAASAVKVALKRREAHPDYTGDEEFNFFLSVLFPDQELKILDYNRVVRDLGGLAPEEFLQKVQQIFQVTLLTGDPRPQEKGTFSMYLEDRWYQCEVRREDRSDDPVAGLDVSLLQDLLLSPVLGIEDPKNDPRIDFVGGIRGLKELERRCHTDAKAAFAMYPTDISELLSVADAGRLMPPKSTWFEPKLRSGLFIHEF
ncbi:MAG: DUF1015 domain-containing protein [Clostridiales bacterium]|nr:DUF1015 domain-containing protein [Clostridiales bacterium]